jgi:hypothetical protein
VDKGVDDQYLLDAQFQSGLSMVIAKASQEGLYREKERIEQ